MEQARYEVTFTSMFNTDAVAESVQVPSKASFRKIAGGVHNGNVFYMDAGRGDRASPSL